MCLWRYRVRALTDIVTGRTAPKTGPHKTGPVTVVLLPGATLLRLKLCKRLFQTSYLFLECPDLIYSYYFFVTHPIGVVTGWGVAQLILEAEFDSLI